MKMIRDRTGPFEERPFFEQSEIEAISAAELREVALFPKQPEPIRVDRFIEKRFELVEDYDELPPGILGYTRFGLKGAEAVIISRALEEEGSRVAKRRIGTTLAHEAGHILLHSHLFATGDLHEGARRFGGEFDAQEQRVLCRDNFVEAGGTSSGGYDGRWWEFQANQIMGALLLPKTLVLDALDGLLDTGGLMGRRRLDPTNRQRANVLLSAMFDVNPVVAQRRTEQLFPAKDSAQLTF